MKVVVVGATGFVGRALVPALLERGDQVVAITRNAQKAREALGPNVESAEWNPPQPGPWMETFNGSDGIVNLSAEPTETEKWTEERKAYLIQSRVDSVNAVAEAIRQASPRPSVLVSASAAGIYGSQGDTILTESSPPGSTFLAEMARIWEETAKPVEELGVRLVFLRTGLVLGPNGGALKPMLPPFRAFFGGPFGPKDNWVPWIHIDDEVGLIIHALTHDNVRGPINAGSPNPVSMGELCRNIGKALGRPCWNPMMKTILKMAMGERTELVFSSWRALPKVAEETGYQFRHTDNEEALRSILA